jgi:hypothetical protein
VLEANTETITAVLELLRGLEDAYQDERGQGALGVARLLVSDGDSQRAAHLSEAEAAAGRFCEACHAAVGAIAGLTPPDAGRMLMKLREWSGQLGDFELWRMARRLCKSHTRQAARRALTAAEPGTDPGDYLLALLQVTPDDALNLAAALELAAPWLGQQALAAHCREIMEQLATASPSMQGAELADLASVAPAEYREEILRRCEHVPAGDRMRVLAGLLVADHGPLETDITEKLAPSRLSLENISALDEQSTFLANLARSGHGDLAIDYLKTSPHAAHHLAAVAEHLAFEDLMRLLGLAADIEPARQDSARAAILPFLIRAGKESPDVGVSWIPWPDAVSFARIATGCVTADDEISLPANSSLRLAAALISAGEGVISLRRCTDAIGTLPGSLAVPVLTEALACLKINDDSSDDLIDCCAGLRGKIAPIERTRLVRAAFRAIGNQLGVRAAYACLLSSATTSWLRAQLIATCGSQFMDAGFSRPELLAQIGDDRNDLVARAGLILHADSPDDELLAVMTLGLFGLKMGDPHELDVLEALPPPQQQELLEQLLADGFLDRSRLVPYVSIDVWTPSVTHLVPAMNPRQLAMVAGAIGAFRDMGGDPRSKLTAAIAVRWARLGDLGKFRSTLSQVSYTTDVTSALLGSVLHWPTEHLADWYDLVGQLDPRSDVERRAILWALARFRSGELDRTVFWTILDRWLPAGDLTRRANFDESWQVLIDLAGYAPAMAACGAPGTRSRIHRLLAPDQFTTPARRY